MLTFLILLIFKQKGFGHITCGSELFMNAAMWKYFLTLAFERKLTSVNESLWKTAILRHHGLVGVWTDSVPQADPDPCHHRCQWESWRSGLVLCLFSLFPGDSQGLLQPVVKISPALGLLWLRHQGCHCLSCLFALCERGVILHYKAKYQQRWSSLLWT